jgi:hypothetical protein
MSIEFVDTNVFAYAHDAGTAEKQHAAIAGFTRTVWALSASRF